MARRKEGCTKDYGLVLVISLHNKLIINMNVKNVYTIEYQIITEDFLVL